jgi:phosphoenolpyruvate carboxykinase (GTP)
MGDYIAHYLKIGKTDGAKLPKIFYVNWFRKDEKGNFIWPGYGENSRVLDWVCRRLDGEVDAIETPIGLVPRVEDINTDGLDIDSAALENLLSVDTELVKSELPQVKEFLAKLGERLPDEMNQQVAKLEEKLG